MVGMAPGLSDRAARSWSAFQLFGARERKRELALVLVLALAQGREPVELGAVLGHRGLVESMGCL